MGVIRKLQRLAPLEFDVALPAAEFDLGRWVELSAGYQPTNPSLVETDHGRLLCVRGVNYRLTDGLRMTPVFTVGDGYHSLNRFVLLGDKGEVVRALPGLDAAFDGAEDVRLFAHDGALWGICSRPVPGLALSCEMTLMALDADLRGAKATRLASPYGRRREKNWLPFVHRGTLHLVYSFEPLVILRCDPASGRLEFVDRACAHYAPSSFTFLSCGSASGVTVGDRHLFIVHRRSIRLPRLRTIYVHRCATLDPSLGALGFGPYFVVGGAEVQFVSGIEQGGGRIRLAYGRQDRRACLAEFDREQFLRTYVPASA
jgi:hypothetical protein